MTQFKVDFNDFKRRDNTNLMEITLYNDSGEQITPNRDHQWSGKALKFGDGDKRLGQELAVTLDGDKIGVPSKQLENLPSGDYGLELWEVNNDSKTIYPSAGFVEFHIHRNADESLESVTPTTDINKVIDDLHQAGLNVVVDGIEMLAPYATPSVTSEVRDGKNHIKLHVPRGLKGDQGPQGSRGYNLWTMRMTAGGNVNGRWIDDLNNASKTNLPVVGDTVLQPDGNVYKITGVNLDDSSGGGGTFSLGGVLFSTKGDQGPQGPTGSVDNTALTNAPAFKALQTQVNNSAVGINLLTGTRGSLQTVQFNNNWNTGTKATNGAYKIKLVKDQIYTYQAWLDNTNGSVPAFVNIRFTPTGGSDYSLDTGTHIDPGKTGYSTLLITAPADGYANFIPFAYASQQTCLVGWKEEKFEKGSVATDWSLNPSEILTQTDYAKIQAAIVALGGSL